MSKIHMYVIGVIAFCLLVSGGIYMYHNKREALKPTYAVIYVEQGTVSTRAAGSDHYELITTNQKEVVSGTFIKTDLGYGYVLLPDNSIVTVDAYTELQLIFQTHSTSIIQILGTTYHRVQALTKGATYEVITPTTVASVRGTKFGVTYATSTKVTKVAVSESVVAVKRLSSGTTTKDVLEKTITEGQLATVSDDRTQSTSTTISITSTKSDTEINAWIEANIKLDTFFEGTIERSERQEVLEKVISAFQTERSDVKNNTTTTKREEVINRVIDRLEDQAPTKNDTPINSTETSPKEPAQTTQPQETKPVEPKQDPRTPTSSETNPATPSSSQPKTLRTIDFREEAITAKDTAYLDAFYSLYESLLLVDERNTVCEKVGRTTAQGIYTQLETFASERGYELPKKSNLLRLAESVTSYCLTGKGDALLRAKVEAEFDSAYPYSG